MIWDEWKNRRFRALDVLDGGEIEYYRFRLVENLC